MAATCGRDLRAAVRGISGRAVNAAQKRFHAVGGGMYTTEGSMFEGLFLRALQVERGTALALELKRAGFDLAQILPTYDIAVWVACVDVAWRHVYPQETRDEAWRLLGRRFIEGYFKTAIGAVISVALPLMSPTRFIERVPFFLRTGLGGSRCEVELVGPAAAVVRLFGPHPRSAILLGGVLEVCFERLGQRATCVAQEGPGDDSVLEVHWAKA